MLLTVKLEANIQTFVIVFQGFSVIELLVIDVSDVVIRIGNIRVLFTEKRLFNSQGF